MLLQRGAFNADTWAAAAQADQCGCTPSHIMAITSTVHQANLKRVLRACLGSQEISDTKISLLPTTHHGKCLAHAQQEVLRDLPPHAHGHSDNGGVSVLQAVVVHHLWA